MSPPLPRRRNGKQQACEPCRKSKIACDHAFPVCDRCKRRKVSAKCVYLAAPMTRPPKDSSHSRSTDSYLSPTPTSVVSSSTTESTPPVETERKRSGTDSGPFKKSAGFFGPTNFSAVFLENRMDFESDLPLSSQESDPSGPSNESLQSQTFLMLAGNDVRGSPRVALGAKVIRQLPDQRTFNFLLDRYGEINECILHRPSVIKCAASIWTTYGKYLKEPRCQEDMEHISATLCKNGEKPLEEVDDYEKWVASFSGTNIRWEILGGVFCALGHAILSFPERDPFFCKQQGQKSNRKMWASELKDCVQACVTLSNYGDLINTHMVALLAKNHVFQTVISGDTSLLVWRQLGDLASATTALGLHRQVDTGQSMSVVSEWKKVLFVVVFNIDKFASLLTGRPPALSSRFTRFSFPLDLSDETRIQGGEKLAREIARLDPNGWNTDELIHPVTSCRAHGMLSVVLNEILELSLGDPEECSVERITHLMERLGNTHASLPRFLRWTAEEINITTDDRRLWRKIALRLKYLESRLLLERLLNKTGGSDGRTMIDCAKEMLELTVLLWVQRDRFVEHHLDYDYCLMCFGVPSSGVLCVELLKRIKQPQETTHLPPLPRSEIVQNLSLLIGFLEWVRPAAGNYQLCSRMRQIIKRILDQILNPPPVVVSQPQSESQPLLTTDVDFDTGVFASGGLYDEGLDNLDWLNSVDWSRGPWIDLGGPENISMDPRAIYLPQG